MIHNASGVLYAAHTGGQTDVPPPAKWEMANWAKEQGRKLQLGDVGDSEGDRTGRAYGYGAEGQKLNLN